VDVDCEKKKILLMVDEFFSDGARACLQDGRRNKRKIF
jgi:hypothetical protein